MQWQKPMSCTPSSSSVLRAQNFWLWFASSHRFLFCPNTGNCFGHTINSYQTRIKMRFDKQLWFVHPQFPYSSSGFFIGFFLGGVELWRSSSSGLEQEHRRYIFPFMKCWRGYNHIVQLECTLMAQHCCNASMGISSEPQYFARARWWCLPWAPPKSGPKWGAGSLCLNFPQCPDATLHGGHCRKPHILQ